MTHPTLIEYLTAFWFFWLLLVIFLVLLYIAERMGRDDEIEALIKWEEEHWQN